MTHADYCNNNMARQNASCHYTPGQPPMYSLNGKIYTKEEFDAAFPTSGKITPGQSKKYMKGENSDGTKRWMD